MQIHRSLFLAAGLSFGACSSTGFFGTQSAQSESNLLTIHVVESSGGGWGASKLAREAMESLEGVDRMMMSGARATLVLKKGAKLTEAEVKAALAAKKMKFESFGKHTIERPAAAYVAKTPKFTWAVTAQKVRAALMKDVAGVQDVFCGPLTVVHMKKGSAPLDTEALTKKLTDLKVVVESVARDDSAML